MSPDAAEDEWVANARAAAVAAARVAREVEPTITHVIAGVVDAHGVALARQDTKFKSEEALTEKIRARMRSQDPGAAAEAAHQLPDVLRYTALLPDHEYWHRGTQVCEGIISAGYNHVVCSTGWNEVGYKGRNEQFEAPDGYRFELQIHTDQSLAATEQTHVWYEEQRRLRRMNVDPERQFELQEMQNAVFDQVSIPPGTPIN